MEFRIFEMSRNSSPWTLNPHPWPYTDASKPDPWTLHTTHMQVGAGGANIRDALRHKILESQFTLIVAVWTYYFDFSNKKNTEKSQCNCYIHYSPPPTRTAFIIGTNHTALQCEDTRALTLENVLAGYPPFYSEDRMQMYTLILRHKLIFATLFHLHKRTSFNLHKLVSFACKCICSSSCTTSYFYS
jgi:hypothetical protein